MCQQPPTFPARVSPCNRSGRAYETRGWDPKGATAPQERIHASAREVERRRISGRGLQPPTCSATLSQHRCPGPLTSPSSPPLVTRPASTNPYHPQSHRGLSTASTSAHIMQATCTTRTLASSAQPVVASAANGRPPRPSYAARRSRWGLLLRCCTWPTPAAAAAAPSPHLPEAMAAPEPRRARATTVTSAADDDDARPASSHELFPAPSRPRSPACCTVAPVLQREQLRHGWQHEPGQLHLDRCALHLHHGRLARCAQGAGGAVTGHTGLSKHRCARHAAGGEADAAGWRA